MAKKIDFANFTEADVEREVNTYIQGVAGLVGADLALELKDRLEADARYHLAVGYAAGLKAMIPGQEEEAMAALYRERHRAYLDAAECLTIAQSVIKAFKK
jgi:hypothetical protein